MLQAVIDSILSGKAAYFIGAASVIMIGQYIKGEGKLNEPSSSTT
jgi:hypothetical protein